MAEFQRPKRQTFECSGVDVNSPIDAPRKGAKFPKLKNMTVDIDGTLIPRPGLVNKYAGALVVGQTPVHSIRRLAEAANSWSILYGVGTHLVTEVAAAPGVISALDTGFSGDPLAIIPWRPVESPNSYAYVYDRSKHYKVAVNTTTDKQIGIPAPTTPPSVELYRRQFYEFVDTQAIGAVNDWDAAGNQDGAIFNAAGVVMLPGGRINTTILRSVPDTSVPGTFGTGHCLQVNNLTNIGVGSVLTIGPDSSAATYESMVKEVHKQSSAAGISISQIIFDTGAAPGFATIIPNKAVKEIKKNALIQIGGGAVEYVRILETVPGIDDTVSFRCYLQSALHAAGDPLQVLNSIRIDNPVTVAGPVNCVRAAVQMSAIAVGKGWIHTDGLTVDLTKDAVANNSAYGDEDYFHISMRSANWKNITMIRVMFDVDNGLFDQNYYYRAIEQSALVPASKGDQGTTDAQIRRRQNRSARRPLGNLTRPRDEFGNPVLDPDEPTDVPVTEDPEPGAPNPTTPAGDSGTGDNQWAEISWKRSEMFRVGQDLAKGWHNVVAVRIEVTVAAMPCTVIFNSLLVWGGGASDIGQTGSPYQYRYRYRDSSTGATSGYSPESRNGVLAFRDKIYVVPVVTAGIDADKIDIERFGGLQYGWCYVGTVNNAGGPVFIDSTGDIAAIRNRVLSDLQVSQPWIKQTAPINGTILFAAGSVIVISVSKIPQTILPGTQIIVNGVAGTIRRPLTAAPCTVWELHQSIGAQAVSTYEIPVPRVAGQTIGRVFGIYEGCIFACDGHYLRWTLGYNPDATHEDNYIEVTDPSDPLVGGFVYNGRAGVWSTRRLFSVSGDPVNGFTLSEVPFGKGAFSPWAIAVGYMVAWLTKDGIYETTGGVPDNITTDDLAPLFQQEGRPGRDANGLKAPKMDATELPYLRLAYGDDGSLFFFYRDAAAGRHCLRYIREKKAWFPYDYAKNINMVYALEGDGMTGMIAGGADAPDAKVYTVGGATDPTTDDGTGFAWEVQPFADDSGDPRSRKYYGDFILDADPANTAGINVEFGTDNHTVTAALAAMTGNGRQQKVYDLSSGNGIRGRNYSIRLYGTTEANKRPRLHQYEVALTPRPEKINLRATIYDLGGYDGDKYVQGIRIWADTFNVEKLLRIEYDGGTLAEVLPITHNGERNEPYSFANPFTARLLRIATADSDDWELYGFEWVFNPEPPAAKVWQIQYSDFDIKGFKHIQQFRPAYASTAAVTVSVYGDGALIDTFTLDATGGSGYANMRRPAGKYLVAKKFKLGYMRLEATTPWRLYVKDTELLMKGWGSSGDYNVVKPIGDVARETGARI